MIVCRGRPRTAPRFGTGTDIWMNLQKNYELRMAAQAIGDALKRISVPQT
jgi:plasmid maintenance system antidote protein VapI